MSYVGPFTARRSLREIKSFWTACVSCIVTMPVRSFARKRFWSSTCNCDLYHIGPLGNVKKKKRKTPERNA